MSRSSPTPYSPGRTESDTAPDGLSVAVLSFDDFDGEPRQVRFAAAFTEDLITELTRNDGLMVTARYSGEAYAEKATPARGLDGVAGRRDGRAGRQASWPAAAGFP